MPGLTVEELQAQRDRMRDQLFVVRSLHAERRRDGDGYTLRWCRECNQNWPCPTIEATKG